MTEPIFYKVQVFATDIRTQKDLQNVSKALDENTEIHRWSIDQEDIDCVLRIESTLSADEMIELINNNNFSCTELD